MFLDELNLITVNIFILLVIILTILCDFLHVYFQVRKTVYIQGNSVPYANVDVLKRLVSARHGLAQVCLDRHF